MWRMNRLNQSIFCLESYTYGYKVSQDGQFHHESRGPDGVTYGCYGYIDQSGILRATHYVADSQGYRTVEALKPVLIYPNEVYDKCVSKIELVFLIAKFIYKIMFIESVHWNLSQM